MQMPNETKGKNIFTKIEESIFLLAFPAFSYLLAFVYEIGYCKTFGVPYEVIKPDLSTFLCFSLPVFSISYFLIYLIDSLVSLKENSLNVGPVRRILVLYYPFIVLLIIFGFIYRWQWKRFELQSLVLAVILLVVVLLDVLDVLHIAISKEKGQSLLSGLKGLKRIDLLKHSHLQSQVGHQLLILFFLFGIGSVISLSLGEADALNQAFFLVPTSHPNSIVIRNYGDKMICVDFDYKKKITLNGFFVLQMGADPNVHFIPQIIGPLNFPNKKGFFSRNFQR